MTPACPNKKVTQCFIQAFQLWEALSVASAGGALCAQHWLKGCLSEV